MLKNTKTNEQGRSMVEMLGVLAIIGVLSVAGIAGYSNAMNKYRANELLNEASKRATIVAMQVTQGRSGANLSVVEFGDNSWSVTTDGLTNQFGIVSPSVSADVCKQVVTTVGTGTIVKKVLSGATDATGDASKCSENAITLVYNNDMSAGDVASGVEPTPQTEPCNGACNTDQRCVENSCLPLYKAVGNYATDDDGNECSTIPCQSCDTGYHWALLSEVISEFPCELVSEGIYSCSGDKGVDKSVFLANGVPYDGDYGEFGTIGIMDYMAQYFPILCRLND